jgi:uncharacterized protein YyaL (SSP411 family)
LGEPRYIDAAQRTVLAFGRELAASPAGCASLLIALDACQVPPTTVLLRGDAAICAAWRRSLEQAYRPNLRVLDLSRQGELPGALAKPRAAVSDAATAWVCQGSACLPPIQTLEGVEAALT